MKIGIQNGLVISQNDFLSISVIIITTIKPITYNITNIIHTHDNIK